MVSVTVPPVSATLLHMVSLQLALEDFPTCIQIIYADAARFQDEADILEEKLNQHVGADLCTVLLASKPIAFEGQPTFVCKREPDGYEIDQLYENLIKEEEVFDPLDAIFKICWLKAEARVRKLAANYGVRTLNETLDRCNKELDEYREGINAKLIELVLEPSMQVRLNWPIMYEIIFEPILKGSKVEESTFHRKDTKSINGNGEVIH